MKRVTTASHQTAQQYLTQIGDYVLSANCESAVVVRFRCALLCSCLPGPCLCFAAFKNELQTRVAFCKSQLEESRQKRLKMVRTEPFLRVSTSGLD